MKKQIKKVTEYVLDEKDAKFIKYCLDYVYHRVVKHKKFLTSEESLNWLTQLRRDLK